MATLEETKLTPGISEKYTVENNTFLGVPKDNPKDKIEIELGDSKVLDKVLPQQKIMRWDNECNVSIRLQDFENFTVETEGEKIKLVKPEKEVHFYQIEEGEGASEFEIILNEKPKTNVMEFSVVDKDVDYFYQPEINDEEAQKVLDIATETKKQDQPKDVDIADWFQMLALLPITLDDAKRSMRPENVVGSYAVYAKSNKVNYVGGKEYKCGKVGHIFRPRIIDSAGTEVWGELHIENGILSVTIPQDFLDKAVYPVRHAAGLTFGYTSQGGSNFGTSNNSAFGIRVTCPSDFASMSKLTAWVWNQYSDPSTNFKGGIWNVSDGNIVSNGIGAATGDISGSPAEWDSNYASSAVLTPSTDYWIGIIGNNGGFSLRLYYDGGWTSNYSMYDANSYTTPTAIVPDGTENLHMSIYCTYTAGGSSSISPSTSPSISSSTSASVSPSISPSVSRSISPSISPSGSISQSISPSVSPSVNPSLSPSISPSISPSGSISQSISPSKSPSASSSISPSISPSVSLSRSPSISPSGSLSLSTSPSVSVSHSPSVSSSISPSASESTSVSQSPSLSSSVSPSSSVSTSPSISPSGSLSSSLSPSTSASASTSVSPSASPSASLSESLSPSVSSSFSPSVSESLSASFSPSVSISLSPSVSQSESPSPSQSISPSASPSPSPGFPLKPHAHISQIKPRTDVFSIKPHSNITQVKPRVWVDSIRPRATIHYIKPRARV